MTDAPAKPPIDEDDEDGRDKSADQAQFVVGRKRPRNLAVILAVAALLGLIALGGLLKAVFSETRDPAAITFPEHMSRSLAEEQPDDGSAAKPAPSPAAVPYQNQNNGEATMLDQSGVVQSVPNGEDASQTESTIDLNTPVAPSATAPAAPAATPAVPAVNGDEKVDEKKQQAGPQSMIQWDRLPVAPQTTSTNRTQQAQAAQAIESRKAAVGQAPKIAIVIDDMGLNRRNSQTVASMNQALTLAYLPYAGDLAGQTSRARANGHELIVHMPMEPDDVKRNNPGPDALLTSNSTEENVRRLDKNLDTFTGYIGINNHMGSRMTADASQMRPILRDLKKRGLWFLDSRTIGSSVGAKIAAEEGVPYVTRDVFLDNVETVPAVLQQLQQVEAVAKKRGYAVAIGHPHDATIAALKQWLPQVQAKGYELVSLSTIIADRFPTASVPQYAQLKRYGFSHETKGNEASVEPAAGNEAKMTVAPFGVHASATKPCEIIWQ